MNPDARAGAGAIERPGDPLRIVGAGPAGLAAAITAARAGRRVVVHERAARVAHRFHGDLQGIENWTTPDDAMAELEAAGIAATFAHTGFREIVAFGPDGREHPYRSARPFFYVIRRGADAGALDASLLAQALAAGVEVRFGDHVSDLPAEPGGIVADGPRGADAIAVGYIFETDAADATFAALSNRLAPGGYAYLLIAGGRGTVASYMYGDFPRQRDYLERTVAFFTARAGLRMRNARRFGGAGAFRAARTARRGSVLWAGEAGGFQDALWGFGLRYAMLSGHCAARSLADAAPASYEARVGQRLGGLLRAGYVNRQLYERLGDAGLRLLLWRLDVARDPARWLGRFCRGRALTNAFYPLARRAFGRARPGGALPAPAGGPYIPDRGL